MKPQPLHPGMMYRIRTKSSRQKQPREHVVTFLAPNDGELLFNARPAAGTQSFAWGEIVSIEPVRDNSGDWDSKDHYMNKVVAQ